MATATTDIYEDLTSGKVVATPPVHGRLVVRAGDEIPAGVPSVDTPTKSKKETAAVAPAEDATA